MPDLQKVLSAIDDCNTLDPNVEIVEGRSIPKELLYSQRMSQQLTAFFPQANDLLTIAARAQHIQRWIIPRDDYPHGKQGYKQWRTELAAFHAKTTTALMREAGYSEDNCERVTTLLQKKGLKQDSEVQILEDVICLVFIEHYLSSFATKHSEDKLIDIIKKTWNKMSDKGHDAALTLPLSNEMLSLVKKSLA